MCRQICSESCACTQKGIAAKAREIGEEDALQLHLFIRHQPMTTSTITMLGEVDIDTSATVMPMDIPPTAADRISEPTISPAPGTSLDHEANATSRLSGQDRIVSYIS